MKKSKIEKLSENELINQKSQKNKRKIKRKNLVAKRRDKIIKRKGRRK